MAKISKKELNEYLSLSSKIDIDLIEENRKSYKIMINGDKTKVSKSSFQNIVLDFIKEQREFNKKQIEFNENQKAFNRTVKSNIAEIKIKVNNLEQDIKEVKSDIKMMKNTPTMKNELKG